jgi:hypothetical protein
LAWSISEESFLSGSNTVSNLKLRASYGVTGQQDIGRDYGYFGIYTRSEETAQYMYFNRSTGNYDRVPIFTIRPEGYDEQLKWEETITYNVGLDFGFVNNRITGTLDVYLRETEDILNEIPIPAGANLENVLITNVGSLENRGLEFTFNALAVETADFSWNIGGNFTYNENEITKLTAVEDENYLGVQHEGISGGTGNLIKIHQVGQPSGSFFVYEQVYDENGMPIEGTYVDRNQDGVVDEGDLYVAGNAIPRFIIGLNTSINYRNWTFSASGRANLDRQVYNNVASNGAFYNKLQTNGQYLSNITTDIYNSGFYEPQYFSDHYVQNGSFFRLDNVTLGYSFGEVLGTGSRLNVSATVNNVFVISPYEGIDPEIFNGVDNNFFPRPRTYVLGVNLSF